MSTDKRELLSLIQQFFLERGVVIPDEKLPSYDFMAAGSLDSFEVLSLIMHIEMHCQISIPAELLLDKNNAEIGNLVDAILGLA
ncbi:MULTISPECIES: phosphopantetheine-binding protein [Pseudoalteromonas]|uniref:Carrier domain-containing protein n=1 Tax=Pseudoalteromonas amylolytica TaxID=1859457 RepID=A0A1S1MVG9_9GAMM|nr:MULTISPECIES: phosphopantetheine-binding protein [Pseudoalteromonas]MCF6434699.1 hypothetical protein [Pseudoalteromonas sp. MMG022]OHU87570.1 hypothetical protein BFC16_08960 [Pseudoalteromonas sp. JW3]OHU91013.1 hypothetical protein BET10_09075 [Pseudoalteromonas amylolytica]